VTLDDGFTQLRDALLRGLRDGGNTVVVTGAGISAASGLRTYRGEGGLWTEEGTDAMTKATAGYFVGEPDQSWAWHLTRRMEAHAACPNAAHRALADLEATLGDRMTLVTQNVDRLHLRAGSTTEQTIEVHGHVDGMRCTAGCNGVAPIPSEFNEWSEGDTIGDERRELLVCPQCGLATRPHMLWFDEFYDEEHFRIKSAGSVAANAALCITVGTSGGVALASRIAGIAAKAGAVLIDINPRDNELRTLAQETRHGVAIECQAAEALPVIARLVRRATKSWNTRLRDPKQLVSHPDASETDKTIQ